MSCICYLVGCWMEWFKMEIHDNIINFQDKYDFGNEIYGEDCNINSYSCEIYGMQANLADGLDSVQKANKTDLGYDFNPDEFLNLLPENDKSDGYRITPSPTNSSTASSFSDTYVLCENERNLTSVNILDTPPISPYNDTIQLKHAPNINNNVHCPNIISSKNFEQNEKIQAMQRSSTTIKENNTVGKLTKVHFKKLNKTVNGINQENTKMVLLSAKDFKNFIKKCKTDTGDRNVFPKILIKSDSGSSIIHPPKNSNLIINTKPPYSTQVVENSWLTNSKYLVSQQKIVPILPASTQNQCLESSSKLIANEDQLKKYERMIKNRKSASLSRMKKKVYVCSLESKVKELGKENCNLKTENAFLRNQVEFYRKQCLCTQNHKRLDLNSNNVNMFNQSTAQHSTNLNKILFNSPKLKKNTAVLLGMLFMVTLNFGTFNNFLNFSKTFPENDYSELNIINDKKLLNFPLEHIGKRRLLWTQDVQNNTIMVKHQNLGFSKNNLSNYQPCPLFINQTENVRIAHTLQKWIDDNNYLNLSSIINKLSGINPLKIEKGYIALEEFYKNSVSDIQNLKDLKIEYKNNKQYFFNKSNLKGRIKNADSSSKRKIKRKKNYNDISGSKSGEQSSKLFEKIERRDDTFYIVSFNTEHILLPAFAYNKSSRPKMSLMLPDGDSALNGKITLMQIDCEVINTTVVDVKENLIPEGLRPVQVKYSNYQQKSAASILDKNLTNNRSQNFKAKAFQNIYMTVLSKPILGPAKKQIDNNNDHVSEEKKKHFYKEFIKLNQLNKPFFINYN